MTTRWIIGIDWDRDGSYRDETARVLSAKWMLGFQQADLGVGNDAQLTLRRICSRLSRWARRS